MHVEEQPAEIEACQAAYGNRPMAVLNERLEIDARFCAVHCTHTAPSDMEAFLAAGGSVCLCPLTEANLGDGVPDGRGIPAARVSLGTDSNLRISFVEEMRWMEYAQRLSTESRGVFVDDSGACAAALWQAATVNGARALGVNAGVFEAGAAADLIALDLNAPTLAGWTPETLLDSFIFGSGAEAIADVYVGGRRVG
jgi:formimidoylglutamate deiminase